MWKPLKELPELYRDLRDLALKELHSPLRFRHPELWRHGFVSERHELYRFDTFDRSLFVSDFARRFHGRRVNDRRFLPVLSNKYLFHEVLSHAFDAYLPRMHGVVLGGRFFPRVDKAGQEGQPASITDVLGTVPGVVLKPIDGGGGAGVHVLRNTDRGLELDNRPFEGHQVEAFQTSLDGYVVNEFLVQHPYAAAIFAPSTNTIRIAALLDPTTEEPFIAIAVHRFGTARSAPVDNATQSGISSMVELDTGELGESVWMTADGARVRSGTHRETGAPIQGVAVPHWNDVKQLVFNLGRAFPYLPYVGWDIVVTEDGPRIIEGNHIMGTDIMQTHKALLADPRVRRFYATHRVTDRPPLGRSLKRLLTRST